MKKFLLTSFIVLLCSVLAFSQNYFRSKKSGAYNTSSTWESSGDSVTWVSASSYPNSTSSSVLVSHSITPTTTSVVNVKNLTISGTITFGLFKEFVINGKLTNNGTLNNNFSTITFGGSTNQVIQGSQISSFYVLKINKSANSTILIKSAVEIQELLTFGTSAINTLSIDTSGSFTFLSNSTSTAHIDILSSPLPVMTGDYKCQKFFPAQSGRYNFMLGSPVSGSTFQMYQPTTFNISGYPTNGFWITGSFTGNNNNAVTGLGSATSSFSYNPTTGLYGAYPNVSNTQTLTQGQGYRFSIRDGGSAVTTTVDKLFTVKGSPYVGDFTFSGLVNGVGTKPFASSPLPDSSTTGGWNLVANPYMSDISIDLSANWILDSMNQTTYIYEASSKSFLPCASGVPTENCIVSAFQGFFVQAKGSNPGLTIQETAKYSSQNTTPVYRVAKDKLNYFGVTLKGYNGIYNTTYIRYNAESSDSLDTYDAIKIGTLDPKSNTDLIVYSRYAGINFNVDSKPIKYSDTTQIYIISGPGSSEISTSYLDNLEDGYSILLYDKFEKTLSNIKTSAYKFDVTSDSLSKGNRFELITINSGTLGTTDNTINDGISIYPNTFTNKLTVVSSQQVQNVQIFDILGNIVVNVNNTKDVYLDVASGVYFVKVSSGGKTVTQKIIRQ